MFCGLSRCEAGGDSDPGGGGGVPGCSQTLADRARTLYMELQVSDDASCQLTTFSSSSYSSLHEKGIVKFFSLFQSMELSVTQIGCQPARCSILFILLDVVVFGWYASFCSSYTACRVLTKIKLHFHHVRIL